MSCKIELTSIISFHSFNFFCILFRGKKEKIVDREIHGLLMYKSNIHPHRHNTLVISSSWRLPLCLFQLVLSTPKHSFFELVSTYVFFHPFLRKCKLEHAVCDLLCVFSLVLCDLSGPLLPLSNLWSSQLASILGPHFCFCA